MKPTIETRLDEAAQVRVPSVRLWPSIRAELTRRNNARQAWRRALVFGAAGILGAVLFLGMPQVQGFAQQIIQRIGHIEFVLGSEITPPPTNDSPLIKGSESSHSQSQPGGIAPTPEPANTPTPEALDKAGAEMGMPPQVGLDKAEQIMGAHVLQASFLPEGCSLESRDANVTSVGVRYVYTTYGCVDEAGEWVATFLVSQSAYPSAGSDQLGHWNIGNATVNDTYVRGRPAKFVEGADIAVVEQDILAWEEGGFDFAIVSPSGFLTGGELEEIAAALK